MAKEFDYVVKISYAMADPEGAATIRIVAGHCQRVGELWVALGREMFAMADALDALVEGGKATES